MMKVKYIVYGVIVATVYIAALSYAKVPVGGIILSFGDMAQSSPQYIIPHFSSEDDAIEFSLKRKWIEPFLQQMIEHRTTLYDNAYSKTHGWMNAGQKQKGNIYWEQWHYVDLSIRIMTNFKLKGIRGDQAMIIYLIPHFPDAKTARIFSHTNKFVPALYEAMQEHIKYLRINAGAKHYANAIANHNYQLPYKEQLAYCAVALHIMDFYKSRGVLGPMGDEAMLSPVGSSVHMGSWPWRLK